VKKLNVILKQFKHDNQCVCTWRILIADVGSVALSKRSSWRKSNLCKCSVIVCASLPRNNKTTCVVCSADETAGSGVTYECHADILIFVTAGYQGSESRIYEAFCNFIVTGSPTKCTHLTHLLTYITYSLTRSTVQDILWKADSNSDCQTRARFLYETLRFIIVFKKPTTGPLSWVNRVQFPHRSLSP